MTQKTKLTRKEFLEKVKLIWMEEVEPGNEQLELLVQIVEIGEDGRILDILLETSSCLVCHSDTLQYFIEKQGIEHMGENHDEIDDKVH